MATLEIYNKKLADLESLKNTILECQDELRDAETFVGSTGIEFKFPSDEREHQKLWAKITDFNAIIDEFEGEDFSEDFLSDEEMKRSDKYFTFKYEVIDKI